MNKIMITNHQLTAIIIAYVSGSATLFLSSSVSAIAGKDAWLSALISAVSGLLFLWLNCRLGELFPDKTIIEVISLLFGKWIGGFVSANFLLLSFIAAAQYVWYISDFFSSKYMPETPTWAISIVLTTTLVIALLYGLEAMARASEVFYYIFFPGFIITMLMLIPNINIENMLPILGNGIIPPLKGTIPLIGISALPLIIINTVYPAHLEDAKKAKKSMFKGYLLGMLITFVSILMCILVLGSSYTEAQRFPVFSLTREISSNVVFLRLEALVMFFWLPTIFNNTLFCFYSSAVSLSQLLRLKNNRFIIIPLGLIMAVVSVIIYWNVPYEINWDNVVWFPYILTFGLILPVMLIVTAVVRRKMKRAA